MDLGDLPQGSRHGVGCVRVEVEFHRGLGRGPSPERGPFVLARKALARCQVDKMCGADAVCSGLQRLDALQGCSLQGFACAMFAIGK